jgi:hypothetical protein
MNKYSVLYVYKQTEDDGQELKHSLRSLKNIRNWDGKVFIAGDKPSWIKDVIHIIPRATGSSHMHDVEIKILAALDDDRLPDDFIYMNDDIYCTKRSSVKEFHKGDLDGERQTSFYNKAKRATAKYLWSQGIDEPLDYDVHTPMIMNKAERRMVSIIVRPSLRGIPLLPRSIYGNLYYKKPVYYEDRKTKGDELPEGDFISTQYFTDELSKLFPEPSEFEL